MPTYQVKHDAAVDVARRLARRHLKIGQINLSHLPHTLQDSHLLPKLTHEPYLRQAAAGDEAQERPRKDERQGPSTNSLVLPFSALANDKEASSVPCRIGA
jgi:hypothetical protein